MGWKEFCNTYIQKKSATVLAYVTPRTLNYLIDIEINFTVLQNLIISSWFSTLLIKLLKRLGWGLDGGP